MLRSDKLVLIMSTNTATSEFRSLFAIICFILLNSTVKMVNALKSEGKFYF